MSDIIIKVEDISKSYIIQHKLKNENDFLISAFAGGLKKMLSSGIQRNSSEEFWALRDINFEIKKGERVGVIGRNGAGKSTLLKILSRIVKPTRGNIEYYGKMASLLEVGTGFHGDLTGRENIYLNGSILGMKKREIDAKFDEIVAFSEVEQFLDTPVKRYSSGMYVRLAFAVAAHLEPEILIVDEVLAVGDAAFQKKCLGKMKDVSLNEGRTILFVSHNMAAIKQICTHGIFLNNGILVDQGAIDSVIDTYSNSYDISESLSGDFNQRKGSGLCRVNALKLESAAGIDKTVFRLGEKISFNIGLKKMIESKVDNLRFIIGVYNSFSESYLRFDTKNTNTTFTCDKDTMNISCALLEHLNIKPDTYSINIAVYREDVLIDYVVNAAKFSIENFDYFETGRDIENSELVKVYYKHTWSSI